MASLCIATLYSPRQRRFPPEFQPPVARRVPYPIHPSRAKYNLCTSKASTPKAYVYPDPDPIFAASETRKFKAELLRTLSKEKETFGNDLQRVVDVCAKVFNDFLNNEYGGPGTLLVEPFTEIMLALKEENLPGAVSAARASLLWAQTNVDQDWKDSNPKLH